jgi:fluoroacetyl-CoA thioesterase
MKQPIKTGTSGEKVEMVGPSNRVTFADSRMPAVLATPWLVAYLEYAARDAIAPYLEDHERSVGTFIEIEHLAPAPEGFTVTFRARVIQAVGPVVTFQVEAHDGVEVIAKGLHRRRVIDVDRFARRVERKRSPPTKKST